MATKAKKEEGVIVSPPKDSFTREGMRELLGFTNAFFDTELQREFSRFLQEGGRRVKVTGKGAKNTTKEAPIRVRMGEVTRHMNPLLTNVQASLGVYNPETITVDTFDLMKKDPTVSAGLAFIKLPIIALPWRINSDSEDVAAFLQYAMKRVWGRLIKSTLTAVEYGFSSHEKVFEFKKVNVSSKDNKGKRHTHYKGRALLYQKFKSHHPDSIQVRLDSKENFNGIIQVYSSDEIELSKSKCFFFTHDEEFGNIFGRSRLVPAYKFWYWKEVLYQFMLMYYERRGSPPVIVTAPTGDSLTAGNVRKNNLDLAVDLGASLLSTSIAAIPYEANRADRENMWKIEYLSDDKRGEMFIMAINHLDSAILRALWIPENTIMKGETGGSYSMSSVHADLFLQSELGLVNDIEVAVNEQIIPTLVQANFKPSDQEPAYIKFDSIDWNRKIALKEIFVEMLRNVDNMVQIGMKPRLLPSLEKLADILSIPLEDFSEAVDDSEMQIGNEPAGQGQPSNVTKLPPKVGPDGRAVPRRATRTSFPGSREADRRDLRPGGDRAEKIRQKLSEPFPEIEPSPEYEQPFYPTMSAPLSEHLRIELTRMCTTSDGMLRVKSGLFRIKVWSGLDLISNYELMGTEELVKHISVLQDFQIMILYEAMSRRLSDDESESFKQLIEASCKEAD